MKICRLAQKLLRFKGEVKKKKTKTCFRLHLLLHNNDYFKGHLACRHSLLEVVNTVVYFGKKGGKIMHCNTKILPIYKLLKIYKTHTESRSCYKNNILKYRSTKS